MMSFAESAGISGPASRKFCLYRRPGDHRAGEIWFMTTELFGSLYLPLWWCRPRSSKITTYLSHICCSLTRRNIASSACGEKLHILPTRPLFPTILLEPEWVWRISITTIRSCHVSPRYWQSSTTNKLGKLGRKIACSTDKRKADLYTRS